MALDNWSKKLQNNNISVFSEEHPIPVLPSHFLH